MPAVIATDPFADFSIVPGHPAERSVPVVKSDADELAEVSRGLYVGTGGDVVGRLKDDAADRTWKNVPSGATLPLRFKMIKVASTAADMVALY